MAQAPHLHPVNSGLSPFFALFELRSPTFQPDPTASSALPTSQREIGKSDAIRMIRVCGLHYRYRLSPRDGFIFARSTT
jgi:hypothetical protein